MSTINERFARAIRSLNLSTKEMAERLGMTEGYVRKLTAQGQSFGIEPLKAVLSALPMISSRYLLFGSGSMFITPLVAERLKIGNIVKVPGGARSDAGLPVKVPVDACSDAGSPVKVPVDALSDAGSPVRGGGVSSLRARLKDRAVAKALAVSERRSQSPALRGTQQKMARRRLLGPMPDDIVAAGAAGFAVFPAALGRLAALRAGLAANLAYIPSAAEPPAANRTDTSSASDSPAAVRRRKPVGVPYYDSFARGVDHLAGRSAAASAAYDDVIALPRGTGARAWLPVEDNAMAPLFAEGDLIAVGRAEKALTPDPGATYVVVTTPALGLRVLRHVSPVADQPGIVELTATNPLFGGTARLRLDDIDALFRVVAKIGTHGDSPEQRKGKAWKMDGMRRPKLDFFALGLHAGDVLTFVRDPKVTLTVASARKVMHEGREVSLTPVTKQLLGTDKVARPSRFWLVGGRNLAELYDETFPPEGDGE